MILKSVKKKKRVKGIVSEDRQTRDMSDDPKYYDGAWVFV